MSTLEILKEQHQACADFMQRRMGRPGGLPDSERAAFAELLAAQQSAWEKAGGKVKDFAGAELLRKLSGEEPAEKSSTAEASSSSPVEENSVTPKPLEGASGDGEPPKAGRSRKR